MEAGVRGWVFKSDGTEDLMAAVEALQRGKTRFSPRVSDLIMDGYKRHRVAPVAADVAKLSPRGREVVQLVCEGKASKDTDRIVGNGGIASYPGYEKTPQPKTTPRYSVSDLWCRAGRQVHLAPGNLATLRI